MSTIRPAHTPYGRSLAAARWLVSLFILTLPFVNPWVRGDGVGYYAYVRALLIDHNLNFAPDWLHANTSFSEGRLDDQGRILKSEYTATNHLDNHFSVGPAMLWSPFLLAAHGFVKTADGLGSRIPADGFSKPYRIAMAMSTAIYGFVGLLLAFDLARQYFPEIWALLATLAIWFASSLPVYMYFNPSWSHAQSAFAVSLFLWYWNRTVGRRDWQNWAVLGMLGGLMIDVYYLNAIFLLVVFWEAFGRPRLLESSDKERLRKQLPNYALWAFTIAVALLPTLVTRWEIYGNIFATGYAPLKNWYWTAPKVLSVLFSADHGLLTWTPILAPALAGLLIFSRRNLILGGGLLSAFSIFLYCIASFTNWDGISSFGNRFFVSFTPAFVIGLAAFLERSAQWFRNRSRAMWASSLTIAVLIAWNLGLMLQWGTQMIPARGSISWRAMIQNQIVVVPQQVIGDVGVYFRNRKQMMEHIEQKDRRASAAARGN